MKIPRSAIALAVVVIVLVGGYYWATEPVRYVGPGTPSAQVRNNPLRAAQILLQRWQRPTRRVFSTAALFPLPSAATTLILDGQRGRLSAERSTQLLNWVAAGGQLIVATSGLADADADADIGADDPQSDTLLAQLGLRAQRAAHPYTEEQSKNEAIRWLLKRFQSADNPLPLDCLGDGSKEVSPFCTKLTCEGPPLPTPARLDLADGSTRFLQPMAPRVIDVVAPDNSSVPFTLIGRAANDQGNKLVRLRVGKGTVTALTDLSLWDNQHLHYFDHAWLLRRLTGDGPVWFVHGIDMPPLPLWLWEHAWPVLLALLAALAAWLWSRLPRPGPVWLSRDLEGADYHGHLAAVGRFHWRVGQSDALLAPLRARAQRRLARLHPDPVQAVALAADRLDTSSDRIEAALNTGTGHPDPDTWTRRVALLQRLLLL